MHALANYLPFKRITCCVKAIHAVNAVLWQPGELTQNNRQTDYYTRGRPRTSGNK